MRFSIVSKGKKGVVHLSLRTAERFMTRIKTDTKAGDITRLRQYMAVHGDDGRYADDNGIATIYPSVEMRKGENGNLEVTSFNYVVTLHVGGLMDGNAIASVKDAVHMLPMTFAAFTGADGKSVEVLVAVAMEDTDVRLQTEQEMDRFYMQAYDKAFGIYGSVLPKTLERRPASVRNGFRMTLDAEPYYNPKATPLTVRLAMRSQEADIKGAVEGIHKQMHIDMNLYAYYEQVYEAASAEAYEDTIDVLESQRNEAYITELAVRLCQRDVPEEEAFLHLRNHHRLKEWYDEDTFRSIVAAVYAEEKPRRQGEGLTVSRDTRRLILFLNTRYVFRMNTVMGYTEYRPNNTWVQDWKPCDENAINGLTLQARLANLDVRDKDVRRYVHSDMIPPCDPVEDFLLESAKKWDGKTDHIAKLARCVPCDIPQWEMWFKKWFLSMVAQWLLPQQEYGNAIVPLLISPQGDGKTTFCRMLLPKELQWGFLENLDVSEKRATLQAMHNFLIINLDEFNQISAKLQEGFLKNVIQLPSVKIKRPYGKHVEEFKRYASFIATTNEPSVLSDPTGSRRFICVNLTAPIRTDVKPDYVGLYGQAVTMVMRKEMAWWFSPKEVKEIMAHNKQYEVIPPAIMYFKEYFEPAESTEDGEWLSPTAIYESLRSIPGSGLKMNGVIAFGRYLKNMPELKQNRRAKGQIYLVKKRNNKK